jgi:PAS domain S-box-containing protein
VTADPGLYKRIVESAPDAVIFADRDGVIRLWNKAAETLWGYTASEAASHSLDLIVPERFREAHWAGYRRAMSTGETKYAGRALLTRSARKDGTAIYVDLMFAIVRDDGGAVQSALATARDATERYEKEKASRR